MTPADQTSDAGQTCELSTSGAMNLHPAALDIRHCRAGHHSCGWILRAEPRWALNLHTTAQDAGCCCRAGMNMVFDNLVDQTSRISLEALHPCIKLAERLEPETRLSAHPDQGLL